MRAQAQGLSSAANRDGSAHRGSVAGSRDAVTRASSRNSDGSSAPSRGRLGVLALSATIFATLVFLVASAFAAKDVVLTIGTGGFSNAPGGFNNNAGLDVNQPDVADGATDPYGNSTDGYIYVADEDNDRVQAFDANHDFVFSFGGDVNATATANVCPRPGNPGDDCAKSGDNATQEGGYFDDLQDVAIDQSDGSLYVMDEDNARVQKFAADGTFIWALGNDVNADGLPDPDLCLAGDTCKAGTNDVAENGFTTNSIGHLAVDPNAPHDLYVADEDHARIQVFDSSGAFQRMYGHGVDDGTDVPQVCTSGCQNGINDGSSVVLGQFDEPNDVDIDDSGRIYVSDDDNDVVTRFDDGTTFANPTDFAPAILGGAAPGRIDIDPGTVAGSADDKIYVLRDDAGDTEVVELDESGAVLDTHMQGAGIDINSSFGGGLALNRALGEIYVSDDSPDYVFVLDDPLPPVALTMDPITTKTDTTATFSGTVDPQGGLATDCLFEYSTDPGFTAPVDVNESDCDSLAPGGGPQAVTEDVAGLLPNTTYFVRMHAQRPFVSGSDVSTPGVRVFSTDSVPPVVTDTGAVQVADVSARLVGTIDPRNSATGYVFEYGTTPALGSSTAPVNLGGGTTPITVSQVVTGLAKDTDYHFRLRATNAFGDTLSDQKTFHTRALPLPPVTPPGGCPNDAIRAQQGTTHLPGCLAYEMVTPPDKNQGGVNEKLGSRIAASPSRDGNAAAFCTSALFGDPAGQQSGNYCAPYLSRRTPAGWETVNPFPPICISDRDGQNKTFFTEFFLDVALSRNFGAAALRKPESAGCSIPPLDPAAPLPAAKNLYRQDLSADPFEFNLLAPAPHSTSIDRLPLGGSDDYSHILYISNENQTPDSPPPGAYWKMYEWVEPGSDCGLADPSFDPVLDACLRLVSVRPDGNPFTTNSKPPAYWQIGSYTELPDSVSVDGSRIFFQNEVSSNATGPGHCTTPVCDLYLREDGIETIHVSRSECTVDCGTDASFDQLLAASPAGDVAFFVSCAKLTDASSPSKTCSKTATEASDGGKFYRWDRNAPEGARLTDITVDREPADGVQANALQTILGGAIADGGDTAFFVAAGQIVSGEPAPTTPGGNPTGMKLYRWRFNGGSPLVDYLGPYRTNEGMNDFPDITDSTFSVHNDHNVGRQTVRVTPDGRYLLLRTRLAYDPAADRDDDLDLYRWGEDEDWQCISCQLPGAPSAGDANSILTYLRSGTTAITSVEPTHHAISEDGRRVYFSTPDALVPEDTNGEAGCPIVFRSSGYAYSCQDIYLWEDGRLSLVTTGTGTEPFVLMGAIASGERVFFQTRQRLVGWDQDLGTDIYPARVNGGFPEPPPAPPACEGEACRGPATAASAVPGPGSSRFEGAGNPSPSPNCGRFNKRAKRKLRVARRAARRGQAKRARALRKQARKLRRRARRCNRRAAS